MQGMDEDVGGDVPWLPPTLKIAWLMNPLTASDGTGLGISRAAKWVLAGRDLEMNPIVLFGGSGSEIFRTGVGGHTARFGVTRAGMFLETLWLLPASVLGLAARNMG